MWVYVAIDKYLFYMEIEYVIKLYEHMLRDVDLKNCWTPTTPITTLYANGEECFSQMKLK